MNDAVNLPSALDHVGAIVGAAAGRLAVFLDYDGTLTPIVGHPEDAHLAPRMRARIERLVAEVPVAIISGRDLADVSDRVRVDGVTYAGSHGLEIRGPAGRHDAGADAARAIAAARATLQARLPDVPGLIVEPKRFGISVHYRLVDPNAVADIERVVGAVVHDVGGLRRHDGKMVFELLPDVPWHKGRAVETLLATLGPDLHPVYIGDDRTDEDAFVAVQATGTGVVVWHAPRPTAASYALADTDEVARLLDALGAAVGVP